MDRNEQIAATLRAESGKQGLLSFGDGIDNVIGVRGTNKNMRLRFKNAGSVDETVYLIPHKLLGLEVFKRTFSAVAPAEGVDIEFTEVLQNLIESYALPAGVPFFQGTHSGEKSDLTITALNLGQNLIHLATAMSEEPTQITGLSMKSFTVGGVPENTNYGNALTHYKLSQLEEPRRSTPLNFDMFQGSRDVSTEMLKIDLIKNNFPGIISQFDVLAITINAGTRMDITFNIGARLNLSEYFYRETKAGNKVINAYFPNESFENL